MPPQNSNSAQILSNDSLRDPQSDIKVLRSKRNFFILASILAISVINLLAFIKGIPVLPQGPETAIAEVTKSIFHEGTTSPNYFKEAYSKAQTLSESTQSVVWQDVFAIDQYGQLRPKHSPLSAFLAVPFYAIFGEVGFAILQQLFCFGLLYSTYLLVLRIARNPLPCSTLISVLLLSQSGFYVRAFSYDLHGCALLIGGLSIWCRKPCLGAFIMGLSLFVRPSFLILLLPLALLLSTIELRRIIPTCLGLLIASLLFAGYNYHLWGDPFLTAYSRLPEFANGVVRLARHPVGFDLGVLFSRWDEKIFSSHGLLPYNLCFLAFPWVVLSLIRKSDRFMRICFMVAVGYAIYIFSYPMWHVTDWGNRFLLPAVYLYMLCFIPLIGRFEIYMNTHD